MSVIVAWLVRVLPMVKTIAIAGKCNWTVWRYCNIKGSQDRCILWETCRKNRTRLAAYFVCRRWAETWPLKQSRSIMCILVVGNERRHINNTEHMLHHTSDEQEKLKVLTHLYLSHSLQTLPSKLLLIRTRWQKFGEHLAKINPIEAMLTKTEMLIYNNSIVWET